MVIKTLTLHYRTEKMRPTAVPRPGLTHNLHLRTMRLQRSARPAQAPAPCPPLFRLRARSAIKKGSVTQPNISGVMPQPSSRTSMTLPFALSRMACPGFEAFDALSMQIDQQRAHQVKVQSGSTPPSHSTVNGVPRCASVSAMLSAAASSKGRTLCITAVISSPSVTSFSSF